VNKEKNTSLKTIGLPVYEKKRLVSCFKFQSQKGRLSRDKEEEIFSLQIARTQQFGIFSLANK